MNVVGDKAKSNKLYTKDNYLYSLVLDGNPHKKIRQFYEISSFNFIDFP